MKGRIALHAALRPAAFITRRRVRLIDPPTITPLTSYRLNRGVQNEMPIRLRKLYYAACGLDSNPRGCDISIDRGDFLKSTGNSIIVGAAPLALDGRVLGANGRMLLVLR